jgi:hypothetical protein
MTLGPRFRSILAFAAAWLALPAVALADDCSDWTIGEVGTCPNYVILKGLGLIAGALIAAAAAIDRWNTGGGGEPDEPPTATPPVEHDHGLTKHQGNFESQNSAYDPAGTKVGGGPGSDL